MPRLDDVDGVRRGSARLVAAIYDIHGNIAALDATLDEVERSAAELVVMGGDIAWGPFPAETIRRMRELPIPTVAIRGNADREVATRAGRTEGLDEIVSEINRWCDDRIDAAERDWLLRLPATAVVDVTGVGSVIFCHGSPRSDEEPLTPATPESRLSSALARVDEAVVVCGHTHVQMDRTIEGKRVVNAGSVGLPYEGAPGAYWALLGPDITLKRTRYDEVAAAEAISASGCPYADEVFAETVRRPPVPQEAIASLEMTAATKDFD